MATGPGWLGGLLSTGSAPVPFVVVVVDVATGLLITADGEFEFVETRGSAGVADDGTDDAPLSEISRSVVGAAYAGPTSAAATATVRPMRAHQDGRMSLT
ncbi:MAG: hypothetical protein JO023_01220 [Chloroflexi bacterium]|nr:hypothetical protein [Chloroflexota bacterium]